MRLAALVAVMLLSIVSANAATPIASVPYRIDYNGWLTVKATVNGAGPYDFIIDTGASQTVVFQNLADQDGFVPTGGPLQTVLGVTAQQAFPPHLVGTIDVGGLRLENLVTVILPDWGVEQRPQGILGLDLLSRFICEFDERAGVLNLYAPGAEDFTARDEWVSTGLRRRTFGLENAALYTIVARINSRAVDFIVDLGALGTVVNRKAVARVTRSGISISVRPSGGDGRERITDALEKSQRATSIFVPRMRVGRHYWYNRTLIINDAQIFEELGVADKPYGLLGSDLLRDRSFVLDFPNETILIERR